MSPVTRYLRYKAVADDIAAGLPVYAAANKHGISVQTAYKVVGWFGVTTPTQKRRVWRETVTTERRQRRRVQTAEISARNEQIVARYRNGDTLEAIGKDYGISRERARQIVGKAGERPRGDIARERRQHIAEVVEAESLTAKQIVERFGDTGIYAARTFGVKPAPAQRLYQAPEIAAMAERVRNGESVRSVSGGVRQVAALVLHYCHANGIVSRYGRWNDRSQRAAIVRDMIGKGAVFSEIAARVSEAEGKRISRKSLYVWARRHVSDIFPIKMTNRPRVKREGPAKPSRSPAEVERANSVKEAARLNYGKATASEIAAAHGVTRNSIIGHWFRLRRAGVIA